MDFALLLVIATAVTGIIWAADSAWRRFGRAVPAAEPAPAGAGPAPAGTLDVIVDYSRSFFPVLLVVLLIRSFLYEPFRIPSSSMMPTLFVGDFIFVNKYDYGLRLPVVNTRILEVGDPKRGDVIVFRLPSDPSINYVKRLVGLPGDTIAYYNNRVYVNGQMMPVTPEGTYMAEGQGPSDHGIEDLAGVRHDVLFMPGRSSRMGTFIVPAGHYFMMGDNRDNSQDSRYDQVGFVPAENLVGRAVRIWMNWDFPAAPKWARIGMGIH